MFLNIHIPQERGKSWLFFETGKLPGFPLSDDFKVLFVGLFFYLFLDDAYLMMT